MNAAFSGGAGYEWGRVRLGGEVTRTTRLPPNFAHILSEEAWTRMTIVTANVRVALPLGSDRVTAYGMGGLGSARVTNAFTVLYIQPGPNPITDTFTRPAFTAGSVPSLVEKRSGATLLRNDG